MAIVWLASYPRSGNTWLRFLLQAYLRGGEVNSTALNAEIPDLHRKAVQINPDAADKVLVKSHFLWSPTHAFADRTAGFVYVLRHPKDVLLSFLQYRKLNRVLPPDRPDIDHKYAMAFAQSLGDYLWMKAGMGTWLQHAQSWLTTPPGPHVLVKYENLQATPETELPPVLRLLGLEIDEPRLRRAIEACRFDALREVEEKEKQRRETEGGPAFFEGRPELVKQGFRFMNEGKSGRTLEHLGPGVEQAFDAAFAPHLGAFGYGPTAPRAG